MQRSVECSILFKSLEQHNSGLSQERRLFKHQQFSDPQPLLFLKTAPLTKTILDFIQLLCFASLRTEKKESKRCTSATIPTALVTNGSLGSNSPFPPPQREANYFCWQPHIHKHTHLHLIRRSSIATH